MIVITTKKGKAGAPSVTYNVSGTYTRRPRYTDNNIYLMNSKERVAYSRELVEKRLSLLIFKITWDMRMLLINC